ncbi:MAG TPA: HEPN family nuclease [Stellaceae bacterium]|nr:HEPN family nuclease [Stellaceae bacterium]
MMPFEPVRDLMRRTIANLQFIEVHKDRNGPYEVTQLINSFLGAVCHPWEAYRAELCTKSLAEAAAAGWPNITKERPKDRDPDSLGDLVGLMRNAVAHGNAQFLPGQAGEIRALRIWNENRGKRTWGSLITVDDMRRFLIKFVELAEELSAQQAISKKRSA